MSNTTQGSAALIVRNRAAALEGAASATVKALLRDDSVKVHATGYEASYDPTTRTVHVPAFSMRADDDPRLVNTFRGSLDRECGRVAFTDYTTLSDALAGLSPKERPRYAALADLFETARVEKLWGRRNPGSVKFIADMHAYWGEKTGGAAATDPAFEHPKTGKPIGVFGAFLQAVGRVNAGLDVGEVHPIPAALMALTADEIVAGFGSDSTAASVAAAVAVLQKFAEPPPEQDEQEQDDDAGDNAGGDDDDSDSDEGDDGEDDADGPGDCEDEGEESEESEEPGEDAPADDDDSDEDGDEDEGGATPDEDEDEDGDDSDEDGDDSDEDGDDSDEDGDDSDEDGDDDSDEDDGDDSDEDDGEVDDGSGPPQLGGDAGGEGPAWAAPEEGDNGEATPAAPAPAAPGEDDGEGAPNEQGVGLANAAESAVEALGGDWGELATVGELVAGEVLADPERRPYTVHPEARASDEWERFDSKQREKGRKVLKGLRGAGSTATTYLTNNLRDVLAAQKQTLTVGGLDDGEDLDEEALPGVALGLPASSIYADVFANRDDNAFVVVLVDCSGSMGTSSPTRMCPRHGAIGNELDHWTTCQKREGGTTRCGQPLKYTVSSPAGYAAVSALALHESLRLSNVPHTVLGYTTRYSRATGDNPKTPAGHPYWSRMHASNVIKVFVEAPGLSDDGAALPYITGSGANLDGEAIKEAAVYAAKAAGDSARVVMIVVSDGLPSAADDSPMNNVQLKRAVEEVACAGIEVYGIGIGISPRVYSTFFPELPALGSRAATGFVTLEERARGLSIAVLGRLVRILGKSVGYSRSA